MKLFEHICAQCGRSFSNGKSQAKYCSQQCMGDSRRLPPRVCPICGKVFETVQSKRVFCSEPCYRLSRRGKTVWTKPDKVMATCQTCGNQFPTHPSAAHRKRGRYCSPKCQYEGIRRRCEMARPKRICEMCGKEFAISASRSGTARFCSRTCQMAHARATGWPNRQPVPHVLLACKICGKVYELPPSQAGPTRAYCSVACHAIAQRKREQFTCEHCGKPFERIRADSATARFCSRKCSHLAHSETTIEKTIRLALTALGIRFEQEYHVGRYQLDFFLPKYAIDVETDGTYWHRGFGDRDQRRDERLSQRGIQTIRLPQKAIETTDPISLTYERLSAVIPLPNHVQLYLIGPQST